MRCLLTQVWLYFIAKIVTHTYNIYIIIYYNNYNSLKMKAVIWNSYGRKIFMLKYTLFLLAIGKDLIDSKSG